MNRWLVGSGIPRRTSCASCVAQTSWRPRARSARRLPPFWEARRSRDAFPRCTTGARTYGGMDADAAKELKELRERNGRLKRLLAEAELEKDAPREVARGKL